MAFDPELGQRLTHVMTGDFAASGDLSEHRMMGGFGYLLNGNLCVGIHKDQLIVRVGQDVAEQLLTREHVGPMDFTGRVAKAWATIQPAGITGDDELREYCQLAIAFVGALPARQKS